MKRQAQQPPSLHGRSDIYNSVTPNSGKKREEKTLKVKRDKGGKKEKTI